ncbi:TraR/DksA family transcriptional regulator [bacterium]|nr:TraR/DksA family transcriptional regulator [bacterium]
MKKKDLSKFSEILNNEKARILNHNEKNKNQDLTVSPDDLADEVDQATADLNQSVTLRLRDRERSVLVKIEEALAKIEEGTYGVCESCEEAIEVKRLEAQPMTELCVSCKEAEEQQQKAFA